jgi:sulfite exporter TauE/SafE
MIDPLFSAALVTGFLGSGHCAGMCGALVAALGLCRRSLATQLLYQAGRIAAYAFLGYAVGWIGFAAAQGRLQAPGRALMIAGDVLVVLLGLASAAAWGRLDALAVAVPGASRALGLAVRLLGRLPAALSALPLGFALGFIPCGLLYSVLLTSGLTGDPVRGARVMVGFGLGTAPALVLFGGAASLLGVKARAWMGRAAGVGVALMGVYNLARHLVPAACHL